MSIGKFQSRIFQNKVKRKFNTTSIEKEIVLMVEEFGELSKAYKMSNQMNAAIINNKDEIAEELSDIIIYCLGLFHMMELSSSYYLEKKITFNEKRNHKGTIK